MHQGRVMQIGTPSEVYSQPALVRRHVPRHHEPLPRDRHRDRADGLVCRVGSYDLAVGTCEHDPAVGDAVSVMVRPERVEVSPVGGGRRTRSTTAPTSWPARWRRCVFRGAHTGVILDCSGMRIEAEVANHRGGAAGVAHHRLRRTVPGVAVGAAGADVLRVRSSRTLNSAESSSQLSASKLQAK